MTAPTCVCCERPMPDTAYACAGCATRAAEQLRQIVDMVPAARDVAHGLSRRGGGGASSGKPGSQLPLDLTATSKLDAVQNELTTWVRHIAEERGVDVPARTASAPDDLIVEAAEWLQGHLEWLRHRQEVSDALGGIAAAARVVAGIARGPGSQRFLGPCGAEVPECVVCQWTKPGHHTDCHEGCPHQMTAVGECDGDIYAWVHADGTTARTGACRTCRATVNTDARTAWLDGEVRAHAFRAVEIGKAYGVNVNTIRSWAARGQLVARGINRELHPVYNVGDVLDLAAADAVRRHELQVKRARRAAARAVETGDAA